MLIVGTTVHQIPASELLKPEALEKVAAYTPVLFTGSALLEGKQHSALSVDKGKEKDKVKS